MPEEPLSLAPVHQADVDSQKVDQLFTDISTLGTIHEVRIKGSPTTYTPENDIGFDTAVDLFRREQIQAIQIRYVFGDSAWIDTVIRTRTGFRIIRVAA